MKETKNIILVGGGRYCKLVMDFADRAVNIPSNVSSLTSNYIPKCKLELSIGNLKDDERNIYHR